MDDVHRMNQFLIYDFAGCGQIRQNSKITLNNMSISLPTFNYSITEENYTCLFAYLHTGSCISSNTNVIKSLNLEV